MQALRNATLLARLVLAWFALALGVALAAPVVQAQGLELVCSGGAGMKLVAAGADDSVPSGHTLDCPLCLGLDAPPEAPSGALPRVPVADALRHAAVPAQRTARAAAPLPARGPPQSAVA